MIIQQNETKWCSGCSNDLLINDFGKKLDGRPRWHCRKCDAKSRREWRRNHLEEDKQQKKRYAEKYPEIIKRRSRRQNWRKKGLDPDMIENHLSTHHGNCDICGLPPNGQSHAIDHCHKSGKFRGILCTKCNSGIAMFNDDPNLFDKAKIYLSRNISSA